MKFLTERPIPGGFDTSDSSDVERHTRIAIEAHRKVGTQWLGTYVTQDRLFGLVLADSEEHLRRFWDAAGITGQPVTAHLVVGQIDPFTAEDTT